MTHLSVWCENNRTVYSVDLLFSFITFYDFNNNLTLSLNYEDSCAIKQKHKCLYANTQVCNEILSK